SLRGNFLSESNNIVFPQRGRLRSGANMQRNALLVTVDESFASRNTTIIGLHNESFEIFLIHSGKRRNFVETPIVYGEVRDRSQRVLDEAAITRCYLGHSVDRD